MSETTPGASSGITLNYVKTHCQICGYGATITRHPNVQATFCLLMRDWMTSKHGAPLITSCNRWELREDLPAEAGEDPQPDIPPLTP